MIFLHANKLVWSIKTPVDEGYFLEMVLELLEALQPRTTENSAPEKCAIEVKNRWKFTA